jgi:hypothetical protein
VKPLAEFTNNILWLAALGACAWFFPRTVLVGEAICAIGTIALVFFERGV